MLLDQRGDFRLQVEGAGAAEEVVELARAVLEGELDVIETGVLQHADALFVEPNARDHEVRGRLLT